VSTKKLQTTKRTTFKMMNRKRTATGIINLPNIVASGILPC
jgi:hypothetical protein